ncbi:holo-ACP synthase [Haloarculaceae archaeon H-GB11]|nr:holo-ACP synthase [Haloarculaceae archaeon H-GB11]
MSKLYRPEPTGDRLVPVVATGIDVVAIDRIASLRDQYGEPFDQRVFTDAERDYCTRRARPDEHFAARFAAKEAFRKTLPEPSPSVPLHAVGVVRHAHGPTLEVSEDGWSALATVAPTTSPDAVDTAVSLTHDRQTGVAAAHVTLLALETDRPRA